MSTTANTRNPVAEGQSGIAEEATKHGMDAILYGMNAMMLVPHLLMQANLEAATHTANAMNRRITTQATLWAGIGTFLDLSGRAGSGARVFPASKSS